MATISESLFLNGSFPNRIDQSININKQIATAVNTYADGSKVYSAFAYADNVALDYLVAVYGLAIMPIPTITANLSGFAVDTTGLFINYATSAALTAATGTVSIAGVVSALTFNSSGQFRVSQVKQGDVVTISVATTTPASTAITNIGVTNGSTFVPLPGALTARALTWDTTSGTTVSGTQVAISGGGSRSLLMDFTKDFELTFSDTNVAPPAGNGIFIGFAANNTNQDYNSLRYDGVLTYSNYYTEVKLSPLDVAASPVLAVFPQNTVMRLKYTSGVLTLAKLVSNAYVDIPLTAAIANFLSGKAPAYLKVASIGTPNTYDIQLKTA